MSECVVRMEMPTRCDLCDFWRVCKNVADFGKARYFEEPRELTVGMKGCKIVCQLPEGHGRLVDAELVKEILKPVDSISHHEPEWTWGELHEINCVAIDNAPTIVPAERSET